MVSIRMTKAIVLAFPLFLLLSCYQKDDLKLEDNFVIADRNGVLWHGRSQIQIDEATDSLIILGVANEPNSEVLVMKTAFHGIGTYTLDRSDGYFYQTIGGDVLVSEYKPGADIPGKLTITEYDSALKTLSGSFEMYLAKVRSNPGNNIDHFQFTDGHFHGIIRP